MSSKFCTGKSLDIVGYTANMAKLHRELQEAVSEKLGLERGSNMAETRA